MRSSFHDHGMAMSSSIVMFSRALSEQTLHAKRTDYDFCLGEILT
jgi:hypothetical protein